MSTFREAVKITNSTWIKGLTNNPDVWFVALSLIPTGLLLAYVVSYAYWEWNPDLGALVFLIGASLYGIFAAWVIRVAGEWRNLRAEKKQLARTDEGVVDTANHQW